MQARSPNASLENVSGNSFTWTPAPVESHAVYGLRVYDDITDEAYSFAFQIQGNVCASP